MTLVQFDRRELILPPKAVIDFLSKMDRGDDFDAERRDALRKNAVLQVAVIPVDAELKQCGDGFLAVTKDISATGLALIHTRALTTPNVVVELSHRDDRSLQLLALVVRCHPIQRFYEIGLQFVTRLAGK